MDLNGALLALVLLSSQVSCDLQDLTWVMDEKKISFFPTYDNPETKFIYKVQQASPLLGVPFVAWNSYSTVEHMGTHMDAPYHFNQNGLTMDQVPLANLMGPLVKIDISQRVAEDRDAMVTEEDLLQWERRNGEIPSRAYVLMYSGWDSYYGDNVKYLGSEDNRTVHFPGFSGAAMEWLMTKRNILGIGVDSISCDGGIASAFPAHQSILSRNKVCIENLKDVGEVPDCGARFMMLPIMMKGGTGTQGRAFAEWYTGLGFKTTCNDRLKLTDIVFDVGDNAVSKMPSMMLLALAALTVWIL